MSRGESLLMMLATTGTALPFLGGEDQVPKK